MRRGGTIGEGLLRRDQGACSAPPVSGCPGFPLSTLFPLQTSRMPYFCTLEGHLDGGPRYAIAFGHRSVPSGLSIRFRCRLNSENELAQISPSMNELIDSCPQRGQVRKERGETLAAALNVLDG